MKKYSKIILIGVLLVLLTIRVFCFFPSPVSYQLFTLFLAYTACVYLGAGLSDSRSKWLSIEFLVSLIIFNFALLGLLLSPIWVAAGYILHGLWDLFHHPKGIQTKVVRWFPPLCVTFDWIAAIFILVFYL